MPVVLSNVQIFAFVLFALGAMYYFYSDGYDAGKLDATKKIREQDVLMQQEEENNNVEMQQEQTDQAMMSPPPEPKREPYQAMNLNTNAF